jgi:hypothetical protein
MIIRIMSLWREIRTPDPQIRSLVTPQLPSRSFEPWCGPVLFSNSLAARGPTSVLPNSSKCMKALSASYLEIEAVALVDGK